MVPLKTTTSAALESGSPRESEDLGADEKRRLAESGIGFDGRYYRYREYRYDRLADAVNYAELESRKSGRPPIDGQLPQWLERPKPSAEERLLMEQFDIAFDGRVYLYKAYRYDRCMDAANYAKLEKSKKA